MVRFVLFAVIMLAQLGAPRAQEIAGEVKLPLPQVPTDLKAYVSTDDVLASAEVVLDILKTAKFHQSTQNEKQDEPSCDAFKRGMIVAHAGFNMFVNAREREWVSPTGALTPFGYDGPYTGLVSDRRGLLLRIWDLPKMSKLLTMRERLRSWPQGIRSDLAAFLTELVQFRSTRSELLVRFPEWVRKIQQRTTSQYALDYWVWRRIEGIPDSGEKLDEFHKRRPEPLGHDTYNDALINLMRQIPSSTRPMDACIQVTNGLMVSFDGNVAAYRPSYVLPAKYMFTFWERRESEGLGALAEYAIQQVIDVLR